MVELTDMKGKELVDINESNNELELIFKENVYIIKIIEGKFTVIRKE
ncbi:MAG: hypothetical protein MRJ93_08660 [Nitrososphaeraceae archaeon]|nr:hypothetical protein [Nitrososphaeraceae archaeon]